MQNQKTYERLIQWLNDPRFYASERADRSAVEHNINPTRPNYWVVRKKLRMNDGTTMSLQFSHGHYCQGTTSNPQTFEVWMCEHHKVLDPERRQDDTDPYAYVPVAALIEYLDMHGGIMDLHTQLAMNAIETSN